MALTQPFINSIPAFDATNGTIIYVNILGGDTVNSVTIKVDNLTTNQSTAITQSVSDNGGDEIRTFGITLNQSAWALLANDCNYQVRAYTTQNGGVVTNSISSSMAWFTCHTVPTIDLYYRTTSGATWTALTSSTVLPTDNIEVKAVMSASTAVFGSGKLTVSKYYDLLLHTWATANITNFNDNTVTVERLTETANGESYNFSFVGETADGMAISKLIQGVKVTYTTMTVIDNFSVQNVCANGNIAIAITFNSANKSNVAKAVVRRKVFGTPDSSYVNVSTITPINSTLPTNISFADNFGASRVTYTYSIVAYNSSGTVLQTETANVFSEFYSTYVGDGDSIYNFKYSWNISNAERVQKSVAYEPFGAKYPTVAYNAKTNYNKQTTKAKLLTQATLNGAEIDRYGQSALLDEFNSFLTNFKAKFFKDFNGNCRLITVTDAPTNSFMQEVGNSLADVQFSWVEVGGFVQSVLNNVGFANGWVNAVNTWKISYELSNCTSNNTSTSITRGGSYTATITANTGYSLTNATVVIYMGGVDVTSTVYNSSTHVISVPSVNGNLSIAVSAVPSSLTITRNLSAGVTSSNPTTSVLYGRPYQTILNVSSGYTAGSTTVTMGGVDVTSTVFDTTTREISISAVTGNIVITASASTQTFTVSNTFSNCSSSRPSTDTVAYQTDYTVVYSGATAGYTLASAAITITVGGVPLSSDGYEYTYNSAFNLGTLKIFANRVVGNISINFAPKIGYGVTLTTSGCTASGSSVAVQGEDYIAEFTVTAGHNDFYLPVINIGGSVITSGYTATKNAEKTIMTVTISGAYVTGNIIIAATAISTAVQLDAPSVYMDGSSLYWTAVAHASSYDLYKGGVLLASGVTSPYALSASGSYQVKAIGDGIYYTDSNLSNTVICHKVDATARNATINGNSEYHGFISSSATITFTLATSPEYTLPESITVSGATSSYTRTSENSGTLTISSAYADVSFSVVGELAQEQLSTPQNVTVSDTTVTFDAVTTTTLGSAVQGDVTYDFLIDGTSIGTYTPTTWEYPILDNGNLTITQVYNATQQSGSNNITLE